LACAASTRRRPAGVICPAASIRAILLLGYAQIPEPAITASVRELAAAIAESRLRR